MEAGWNERKKSEKLADNRVTKGREFFPLFPVLIKAYEKKKACNEGVLLNETLIRKPDSLFVVNWCCEEDY